jgi:hypothetical protein
MGSKRERVEIEIPSKAIRIQHASCSNGHNLMDVEHKINGYSSISVLARFQGREGMLYLDPVYGSYTIISDLDISKGEILHLSCPHCNSALSEAGHICDECSAPLFSLMLPHGSAIEACLRSGCHFHNIALADADEIFKKLDEENTLDSFL